MCMSLTKNGLETKLHIIIPQLVLVSGTVAVPLKDFPEYVRRMQRKDYGKKSMFANEYEVTRICFSKQFKTYFTLSYAEH